MDAPDTSSFPQGRCCRRRRCTRSAARPARIHGAGRERRRFTDYKALVCVFLLGGNDSWSMVVPRRDAEYARLRRVAPEPRDRAGPAAADHAARIDAAGSTGCTRRCRGCRRCSRPGRCAVIANVGPLIEPTSRARSYRRARAPLPPQLFSHNDQQNQWHTLRGDQPGRGGWAGRIADLLAEQTGAQRLPLNVSLYGTTSSRPGKPRLRT